MKKYNLINNTLGWLIFLVAALTYLLTIEPTASFWDCPEFIAQGYKTEIGHPPGNPIFILAANFASKFAGGDVMTVAKCVNAMSAIFSALTILLLFWSITHLVKKLVVKDGEEDKMSLAQYLVVMGSGICGALAYTWSDTFWFSAVEAEVYAFSSFCTALVFWLILKWENRADQPGSDRWIVLIAYVFGVSLGVHLLNLLCIPAIALIFYYRQCRLKGKESSAKGSLLTLLISFVIVGLILYGLEPGFVEWGQKFDLFFVNTLGMSFNSGVLAYAIVFLAICAWALWELYRNKSDLLIKISFALAIIFSGMILLGDSILIPLVLIIALCVYLFKFCKHVPVRVFTNIVSCILVIFIGFSCYALILIRSSQNTPLDENSPNNTFSLAKYLSREQYGETPLLYGRTVYSDIMYQDAGGSRQPATKEGPMQYAPEVKTSPDQPDRYKELGPKKTYRYSPEQDMLFPRIHDEKHAQEYVDWLGMQGTQVEATTVIDSDGNTVSTETRLKPTMVENLRFFVDYQLNYMYWRYFMWNFAGRQNDIQGMGEITHGNWISGYSFIDNPRLGDQSLLPDDLGKGNKGHNVFYLLPLLMGIIGLLWQAYRGRRGIEQFWVIFFLFFMTGIAIVLYLNQTPSQPRERDYAYAGSFYAFSIWIGMGVAGLWALLVWAFNKKGKKEAKGEAALETANKNGNGVATAVAAVAALVGILVPLQMVSQTWDDHDRSGRYAARDFGRNYLSSVAPNGVIFCNGDNDTFPLWYLQEVEGFRTDVRAVNLSYLATDWYISQMQRAAYESAPVPMQAGKETFAYDDRLFSYFIEPDMTPTEALKSLAFTYGPESKQNRFGITEIRYPMIYMPVDADQAIKTGTVREEQREMVQPNINLDLTRIGSGMTSSQLMSLDMIASSIAQGWNRPCYFAMTVPESYYLGLSPYLRLTGLAYQVTPIADGNSNGVSTDIMYDNVVNKFAWGGLDTAKPGSLYLDETICRMVTTMRSAMLDLATSLTYEGANAQRGDQPVPAGMTQEAYAADRFKKARTILDLMMEKLPLSACPFTVQMGQQVARAYLNLGNVNNDKTCVEKGTKILENEILRYAGYLRFYQSLNPSQYERLTRADKYIDQQYVVDLLGDYGQYCDEKQFQEMSKKLQAAGVNMDRLQAYQQAYERALQQQYEGQQQPQEAEE